MMALLHTWPVPGPWKVLLVVAAAKEDLGAAALFRQSQCLCTPSPSRLQQAQTQLHTALLTFYSSPHSFLAQDTAPNFA